MIEEAEAEASPERASRWALVLVAVALVVHVLMMGSLFWGYLDPLFDNSNLHDQGVDFFSIYEAGHRALEGGPVYAADPGIEPVVPYSSLYRYVPGFAYVFALPLNALHVPAWPAYWGWVAFYELLLAVNAYATWRLGGRGTWGAVGAAMWFVFSPFYLEQYMGQFSFLMATLLLWTGVGTVHRRESLAGPPWVASLVVKSSSALIAPLFLRLRWWRPLVAGAALGGLSLVYFLWRPDEWDIFWLANTGVLGEGTIRSTYYNGGDLGAVALLRNSILAFDAEAQGVSAVYTEALAYTVIGVSLLATFWPRRIDPLAVFAMWVASFFLVYTVWEHHFVMLLPALVLLVLFRPSLRPLALAAFVLIALPTPYWLLENVWNTGSIEALSPFESHQEVWPAWGVITQHAIKVVPVALLWVWLAGSQLWNGVWLPASLSARLALESDRPSVRRWRRIAALSAPFILVGAVTLVVLALALPSSGDSDPACREAPSVCAAVRDYLETLDAGLPDGDRVKDLHIMQVTVIGSLAVANAQFTQADQEVIEFYRVVQRNGRWLVSPQ